MINQLLMSTLNDSRQKESCLFVYYDPLAKNYNHAKDSMWSKRPLALSTAQPQLS